jgi:hypothetical protein
MRMGTGQAAPWRSAGGRARSHALGVEQVPTSGIWWKVGVHASAGPNGSGWVNGSDPIGTRNEFRF